MQQEVFDYVVIGGGPAGVQASYFLEKAGYSYVTLERSDIPGSFFAKFPRQRRLISINKIYTGFEDGAEINMRWDWNSLLTEDWDVKFKNYSREYFPNAGILPKYLQDYVSAHGLNIRYNKSVANIARGDDRSFIVETHDGGTVRARRVIVATGRPHQNIPDFPGNELCMTYESCPDDPEAFANKRVLVVGKGNSAFETAESMIAHAATIYVMSPNPVRLAWKSHYVGHLRALNNNFLDTFQLKSQNTLINANILSVVRTEAGDLSVEIEHTNAEGQRRALSVDEVILCTGFRFDSGPFDMSCRPEMTPDGRYPAVDGSWQSINVPDLYFAGTLMHSVDYGKGTSGFIHGFRYNIRALSRILADRYHATAWGHETCAVEPAELAAAIIDRVDVSASLFQVPAVMTDVIVPDADAGHCRWFRDVPRDYAAAAPFTQGRPYFTLSLEFGDCTNVEPFTSPRFPYSRDGSHSKLIHPVIRHFDGSVLLSEHHVMQNMDNCWKEERFIQPLRQYLADVLAGAGGADAPPVTGAQSTSGMATGV
ncbi:MAG: NAD(P)-binding domain-containing protein [Salinarimonas sp.]